MKCRYCAGDEPDSTYRYESCLKDFQFTEDLYYDYPAEVASFPYEGRTDLPFVLAFGWTTGETDGPFHVHQTTRHIAKDGLVVERHICFEQQGQQTFKVSGTLPSTRHRQQKLWERVQKVFDPPKRRGPKSKIDLLEFEKALNNAPPGVSIAGLAARMELPERTLGEWLENHQIAVRLWEKRKEKRA